MSDAASAQAATTGATAGDPATPGRRPSETGGSNGTAGSVTADGMDSRANSGMIEATVRTAILSYEDFRIRPHNCFACGELNEVGLHLKLNLEPERCWTELVVPRRFEGWEGIIHGGILCTIMDEVMAWALVVHDNWGVTARLSIDFRQPVAVGQSIRAEGWITEAKRRIQLTAGRILDAESGRELATAQATYVAASEARKRELKERYGVAVGPSR